MLRRMRLWLQQTHGAQFELVRHFLSQQLAHEFISSDQARRLIITILTALGCVGPLIIRLYLPKYAQLEGLPSPDLYDAAVHADRLFFISLSMITVGLISAFQWQNLFPSRQDYLTLKPLPLGLRQVFAARFVAVFVIFVTVVIDLNLATSALFPLITSGKWQRPLFGMRYVFAHAAATIGAGLLTFLAIIALQGACLTVFSFRVFEKISVGIQAVLVTLFIAAIPSVFDMPNWHRMIQAKPHWLMLFPPAWFLGLYERLLGTQDAFFWRLAHLAIVSLWTAFAVAAASYLISYRRHASRILEQAQLRQGRRALSRAGGSLPAILISSSRERAVFGFVTRTLQRSRHHNLLVQLSMGLAFVLAVRSVGPMLLSNSHPGRPWEPWQIQSILALPLVIGTILISTLRYVFQLSSEVPANWIFRMAESYGRRELLDGTERVLVVWGVAPVILLCLPIEVLAVGWLLALAHSFLAAMLLLLLVETGLRDWHKIPFTCTYLPGRRNIWQIIGLYLLVFAVAIPVITFFEAQFPHWLALLGETVPLTILYAVLRSERKKRWTVVPLLFDESEESLIRGIGLHD
jgi:hypothetical protein